MGTNETQDSNKAELLKPISEEVILKPESVEVQIEKQNEELGLQLQQSEGMVKSLESQFDTSISTENQSEVSLDPRIVGYFREQLGAEETLNRLRQCKPEDVQGLQSEILEGNLENVVRIMDDADHAHNDYRGKVFQKMEAGSVSHFDEKARKEDMDIMFEQAMHSSGRLERQMDTAELMKRRYDPKQERGAHFGAPGFTDFLEKTVGINKGSRAEVTDPQEKLIMDKIGAMSDRFDKLKKVLFSLSPESRKTVLVSDEELLNATEADLERFQSYL